MSTPRVLMTGLAIGESPRWHDGRLWLSNWGTKEIVAVDLQGKSEVVTRVPTTIPFSIDWLPDGRLLVVCGPESKVLRREPDGSLAPHADLSGFAGGLNEIVVDGRGNIYVNGSVPPVPGNDKAKTGFIALITPAGAVRRVADDIAFPNGMIVTPDNKTLVIADSFGHLLAFDIAADGSLTNRRVRAEIHTDGICLDAEGAIWAPSGKTCQRISPSGQVLQRVELDRSCFACMLGGEDGKTLFMLAADWHMAETFMDNLDRLTTGPRTGQVLTLVAPVPRAGRP